MRGETYFHQDQFHEALRDFLRVDILHDAPRWQAAALLEAGKVYERLDQWADAAETYERLLKQVSDRAERGRGAAATCGAASRRAAATGRKKGLRLERHLPFPVVDRPLDLGRRDSTGRNASMRRCKWTDATGVFMSPGMAFLSVLAVSCAGGADLPRQIDRRRSHVHRDRRRSGPRWSGCSRPPKTPSGIVARSGPRRWGAADRMVSPHTAGGSGHVGGNDGVRWRWAWVCCWSDLFDFAGGKIVPPEFTARFLDRLHEGKLDCGKALDHCELNPSPAARVALAAVRRWDRPAADQERAVGAGASRRERAIETQRRHVAAHRRAGASARLAGYPFRPGTCSGSRSPRSRPLRRRSRSFGSGSQ